MGIFKKYKIKKVLSRGAGAAGTLLVVSIVLELTNIPYLPNLYSWYSGKSLFLFLMGGTVLLLYWHLTERGYKGFYFYILTLTGTGFILLPSLASKAPAETFLHMIFGSGEYSIPAGLILLFLGRWLSLQTVINSRRITLWAVTLTTASFIMLNLLVEPSSTSLVSYNGELESITKMLNPSYLKFEDEIKDYIKDIVKDNSLTTSEKDRLIEELNKKIEAMENESALFEEVKKQNEKYLKEIASLKEKVGETSICKGAYAAKKVESFEKAVCSSKPCVRDFSVKLASSHPGSYYRGGSDASPGKNGVLQIISIHRYISGQWKYVNDPLFAKSDYYSPADRTIALGLAGDCDDFAILLASCIEAIGGRARIVGGECSQGAHAWAEVYIGNSAAWNDTVNILKRSYPGISIEGAKGEFPRGYWLSLDWSIGKYSCGGNPVLLYESGRRG